MTQKYISWERTLFIGNYLKLLFWLHLSSIITFGSGFWGHNGSFLPSVIKDQSACMTSYAQHLPLYEIVPLVALLARDGDADQEIGPRFG